MSTESQEKGVIQARVWREVKAWLAWWAASQDITIAEALEIIIREHAAKVKGGPRLQ